MELAIPVVVKFLSCHHKELSHNVSSYLSLAAIDNADRLAKYMDLIINSILKGELKSLIFLNRNPIFCTVLLTD